MKLLILLVVSICKLAQGIRAFTLGWQFGSYYPLSAANLVVEPSGTVESVTESLAKRLSGPPIIDNSVASSASTLQIDTGALTGSIFVTSVTVVLPSNTYMFSTPTSTPTSTLISTPTETIVTTVPKSSGGTSHDKKVIIIGAVVGAIALTFTGVMLALFKRQYRQYRQARSPLRGKIFEASYNMKNESVEAGKIELSNVNLPSDVTSEDQDMVPTMQRTQVTPTLVSPTSRQQKLQVQAGSIREDISAILEIATVATGLTEDTVVVQRRIIQELTERVGQLEELLNTDWARELTDEPPPQYSEILTHIM